MKPEKFDIDLFLCVINECCVHLYISSIEFEWLDTEMIGSEFYALMILYSTEDIEYDFTVLCFFIIQCLVSMVYMTNSLNLLPFMIFMLVYPSILFYINDPKKGSFFENHPYLSRSIYFTLGRIIVMLLRM